MSTHKRFIAILAALAAVGVASSGTAAIYRVAATGNDSDGASWTNAYTSIGKTVNAANVNTGADAIWVKQGAYDVTDNAGVSIRNAIGIIGDLSIYGGLDGDEADQAAVDAQATGDRSTVGHTSVIVNLAASTEATTATKGVFNVAADLTVLMDQVDVTSGVALVSTTADCGFPGPGQAEIPVAGRIAGGINTGTNCILTLTDCKVSGIVCLSTRSPSTPLFHGGPIQMRRGAQLNMTNCVISDNTAQAVILTDGGVGVVVEGLVNLHGCTFDNNFCGAGPGSTASRRKNSQGLCVYPPCPGESVIANCTFSNNSGGYWGPLRISYDTTGTIYTITDCTFSNNEGTEAGAMLMATCYCPGGRPIPGWGWQRGRAVVEITGCTFSGNRAVHSGGGAIREVNGSPLDSIVISDCTFSNNWSVRYGAALLAKSWNGFDFVNCEFTANSNDAVGGASVAQCEGDNTEPPNNVPQTHTFTNCLFQDNASTSASLNASVVDIGGSNANGGKITGTLVNCTFVRNTCGSASGAGSVVINRRAAGDRVEMVNCVCADNTAAQMVRAASVGMVGRIANCVTGGLTPVTGNGAGGFTVSNVDTSGVPRVLASGRLTGLSSAIDAGLDADTTVTIPTTDKDGKPRTDFPGKGATLTDLGAFEYQWTTGCDPRIWSRY